MIEWVLDTRYAPLRRAPALREKSVVVFGSMEATLTPLIERIEAEFAGVKVFSLPSVDHPEWGRHIELGVKGRPELLDRAYAALIAGLRCARRQAGPRIGALAAPTWCASRAPHWCT